MFLKVFSFSRLTAGEFLCFCWLDDLCLGLLKQNEGIGGTELPNEGYSWGTRMSQEVSKLLVNGLIITYL